MYLTLFSFFPLDIERNKIYTSLFGLLQFSSPSEHRMEIIQYKTNKIVLEPFHVLQILVYLLELQPKSHHIASDTFHIHLMTVQIVLN